MSNSTRQSHLRHWVGAVLGYVGRLDPIQVLTRLLDAWDLFSRWQNRRRYRGVYEILDYDATLEIIDPQGKEAVLIRREMIRFLQDNVVAIHDHAWGDGQPFVKYQCQPGVPVDCYEDGSKHNILISLRETKNRGDVIELWIERVIRDGLLQKQEWFETEIDHLMKNLSLSIIFPKERPSRRATLSKRSTGQTTLLPQGHFALLPDGRQKLTWKTSNPRLHDRYTIKWIW